MLAIINTALKYLRQPLHSHRVMTKDKTKIRPKDFANFSKAKTNVMTSFCPKL